MSGSAIHGVRQELLHTLCISFIAHVSNPPQIVVVDRAICTIVLNGPRILSIVPSAIHGLDTCGVHACAEPRRR